MHTRLTRLFVALTLVLGTTVAVAGQSTEPAGAAGGGFVDLTGAAPATFDVNPGVEQLTVTGAIPRSPLTLVDGTLERIVTLYTDDLGQLTFQYVPDDFLVHDSQTDGVLPTVEGTTVRPGTYRVVAEGVPGEPFAGTFEASDPFEVMAVDDIPDASLYDSQVLPSVPTSITGGPAGGHVDTEGFGYLETRDGTKLSVSVRLPDANLYGPGPYPTVVQYSGYEPSKPGEPSGADAGGRLALTFGFAYVGVNLRGSGCSGGVFDTFNAAQAADGYDVIETVARQPFVKNDKVGMIGISYSGITQLLVGSTRPPSLAAITPLSVIEDAWNQQWPAAIYNSGFTEQWLSRRDDESAGGAAWVNERIANGDTTCEENRLIRSQNIPFEDFARSLEHRPADADARNFSLKARDIVVPTFLGGAWQDEQTGPQFAMLLDDFTSVPAGQTKFNVYNGHHPDGFSPLIMSRWVEFLSFYVDRSVPRVNPLVRAFGPTVFEDIFGAPGLVLEDDRFVTPEGVPLYGDLAGSLAVYEAEPQVRTLFEVGASPDFAAYPGAQRERFSMTFPSWPPSAAEPHTFYLGADGTLADTAPAASGIDRYAPDPDVLGTHYFVSGDHGARNVVNDWRNTADGKGLAYETAPLAEDMVMAGPGYVDLWFRSDGTDAPIEVVLSEVYADPDPTDDVPAEEVRVQHGLMRAGFRQLDASRSSGLLKQYRYTAADYEPLPAGEFVHLQVPISDVAHPFRAGSRLRLEINTPGADTALWDFVSSEYGATANDVSWGGATPSALVLPMLPASDPSLGIPAQFAGQDQHPVCDSLRGQPCRDYARLVNQTLQAPPTTTTITSTTSTTASTATTAPATTTTTSPTGPSSTPMSPAAQPVRTQASYTG
ncbi:MAG: CocE/NonD family hydrolase [Actinobacteria bacterium]|nr:CocE/NonD family hydrolase [Actinomycetota bacterium]